jgi:xylulokinase
MYFLGFDIGSSSVKVSLIEAENGKTVSTAFHPKQEMKISALKTGWAEQDPEQWWINLKKALRDVLNQSEVNNKDIKAIGISYQMHGLVLIDKEKRVLRPSIIWCDSRAVDIGNKAFNDIGQNICHETLLNSPGNFTASKLKWVKDNEPDTFKKIFKILLPGDYIALKLTGKASTTISGLSEGIFWDFKNKCISKEILNYYGFDESIISEIVPNFGYQGELTSEAAEELELNPGTIVSYRAGDQPNNAFSLNVLNPGEIAATAGTSGVIYGISDQIKYDPLSRVNTFAHVNYSENNTRLGILLCVNGTGIQNSWLKNNIVSKNVNYPEINNLAADVPIGSDGLIVLPFGNGAERMLCNKNIGASIHNINFNIHTQSHVLRAAQEGIVFSLNYGLEIMKKIGLTANIIRAGKANMFLSPIFRNCLASITGATIELYNTDGSAGAARAAGIGAHYYKSLKEAFDSLEKVEIIEPDLNNKAIYENAYANWKKILELYIEKNV